MSVGIVLIHGYTGTPASLQPLADKLSASYSTDSVTNITLPDHDKKDIPSFKEQTFVNHISDTVESYQQQGRKIVLLGHSTGGILALASISDQLITPHLLVLISVPKGIDTDGLIAIGIRNLACREVSKIIGANPKKVVSDVSMIGLNLRMEALKIDS